MRRLAAGCLGFSAAVFAANYIFPLGSLLLLAALFAAAGAGLLLLRRKWLRGVVIGLFAFALGLLCFYGHALGSTEKARQLDGQTLEISGRVLEYPRLYDDYCRTEVLLETEGLPRLRALLYDSGEALRGAVPGQRFSMTARLSAADTRYGEPYDYYNSQNIYLLMNARTEAELSEPGFVLSALPARLSRAILDRIDRIFPADTAVFMKSLTLGDKSGLYEDEALYLSLSRAGLMHIVAVSGMHIAFLASLMQLLLGRTRKSALLSIALIWLFVLVVGAGPSAVRAGVMQSLLLFAPVADRENDPVTSLSLALALILLANPYAAASVSLQLSFAATAGICCLTERIYGAFSRPLSKKRRKLLRKPLAVAASSVSVAAFTVPLSALHFGTVSLLAPLANILCLWAVSLCFCGVVLACALSVALLPLGAAAAWLVSWPARYLFAAASLISRIPFAAIYTQSAFTGWWVALCYGLFIMAALSRAKLRFKLLFPTVLAAVTLAVNLLTVKAVYASGRGVMSVLDVGQGQCLSVFSGDKTFLIDCGGIGSLNNAGETAGAYLRSRGRQQIDALLLTHLHADHANGVTMLMEMADVKLILMPEDPDDEDGLLTEILEKAQSHGTEVRTVSQDETLNIGGIQARLFAPGETGGLNERCVTALVSLGDYDMLVTADAPKTVERELAEKTDLSGVELLIAGHHGSRNASSGELLSAVGGGTAVVSVGLNSYGHPTYETLERLSAYGFTIYRTDLNGTVEFRIG